MPYSNPPVPSDAFLGETASSNPFAFLDNNEEVFEGVIKAKKEKDGHFFRKRGGHHNNHHDSEDGAFRRQVQQQAAGKSDPASISPRPIQVLICSRRRMEQYLRDLGSGSSCLWVPSEEFSPNGKVGRMVAKQLQLAYSLRSEWGWQSIPILIEAPLELAPTETSEQVSSGQANVHESLRKQHAKESTVPEVAKSSNDARYERNFLNEGSSPSERESLGGSQCDKGSTRMNNSEEKRYLTLIMSKRAFLELFALVSPNGGLLRDFQAILKRLVPNSNFLDVDVKMVNFYQWLEQHPLAIFLNKSDIVIVKQDGHMGVCWTLLRFDFDHGLVKSTSSRNLNDIELNFGRGGDKIHSKHEAEVRNQNDHDSSQVGKEDAKWTSRTDLLNRKWNVSTYCQLTDWTRDGGNFMNPFLRIVSEALGSENPLSQLELNSLASILQYKEDKDAPHHSLSSPPMITTVLGAEINPRLSSKEKYALTCLGSDLPKLQERALFDLLSLLLKSKNATCNRPRATWQVSKENISNRSMGSDRQQTYLSRPAGFCGVYQSHNDEGDAFSSILDASSGTGCPQTDGKVASLSLNHALSYKDGGELGNRGAPTNARVGAANERYQSTPVAEAGNDTDNDFLDDQKRECEPSNDGEELKTDKLDGMCSRDVACEMNQAQELQGGVDPIRLMEWLRGGFLEAVFDRFMTGSHDMQQSLENYLNKTGETVSVEVISAAWLKVLEIIPRTSGFHLAKLLVRSLQNAQTEVMKLSLNLKYRNRAAKCTRKDSVEMAKDEQMIVSESIGIKPTETNLQLTVEKLSKIGKLLSSLMAKSPIMASLFAQSGGLDLLFDLYFCLVKKFPINLRFGALSSIKNSREFSDAIDSGNLPGEMVRVEEKPVKVLPCVLPSACICRFATACLMDHCMTPRPETVDISWPSSEESQADGMCPLKTLVSPSSNTSRRLHKDGACNSTRVAQNDADELAGKFAGCNEKADCEVSDSKTSKVTDETNATGSGFHSSGESSLKEETKPKTDFQCLKIPCSKADEFQDSGHCKFPSWNVLNGTCTSSSRASPRLIPLVSVELPQSKRNDTASVSGRESSPHEDQDAFKFNLFTAVHNVKLHFLQTMVSLVSSCSLSLFRSNRKLIVRYHNEGDNKLLLQFLPDITGAMLNIVPKTLCNSIKKLIFEIIMALDLCKSSEENLACQHPWEFKEGLLYQPCGLCNNSSSDMADVLLSQGLMHEIGERLKFLLCHLEQSPCPSPTSKEDTAAANQNPVTTRAWKYCDPLFESTTISNGHLLSLWVDVGLLLRALASFVSLWPGRGHQAVKFVLKHVGSHIENVLQLLATNARASNWSLAHIVTMEHLLQLLVICMSTNFASVKGPEQEAWNEVDDYFWRLFALNDSHWNCIKDLATWIVMKSCKGCIRSLFEGYQKVLWEPLEVYYGMLGQRMDHKFLSSTASFSSCPDIEFNDFNTSLFVFIKLQTLLMKKRWKYQGDGTHLSFPPLCMEKLSSSLEFLMNPMTGLLMSVISSPAAQSGNESLNVTSALDLHETSRLSAKVAARNNNDCVVSPAPRQCKKCLLRNTPTHHNLSSSIFNSASWMRQECLSILTNIFSLTSFHDYDEQASLSGGFRNQNPFLSAKYSKPFLEEVFFLFLKTYNLKTDNNCNAFTSKPILPQCSPFERFNSSLTKTSGGGKQRNCGCASLTEKPLSAIPGQSCALCSSCYCRCNVDECSSRLCVTYAKVMKALAQSQTRDVSHSFRHIGIMRFLVQQISLEYESSQVAADQGNISLDSATARASLQGLPQLFRGSGGPRAHGLSLSDRTSKLQPYDEMRDEDAAAATTRQGKLELKSTFQCTWSNFKDPVCDKPAVEKALLVDLKGALSLSQTCRLSTSKSVGLDKCSLAELSIKGQHYDLELQTKSEFHTTLHNNGLQLCKRACDSNLVDAGDRKSDPESTILKLPVLAIHAEQNKNAFLRQPSEAKTHDVEVDSRKAKQTELAKQGTACCHPMYQQRASTDYKSNSFFDLREVASSPNEIPKQLRGAAEKAGRSTIGPTQLKYAGRFFDLNEEVERELASEYEDAHDPDYPLHFDREMRACTSEETGTSSRMDRRHPKLSPVRADSSRLQKGKSEYVCDAYAPPSKLENASSPKKASRPTIPKLNLSKSARKGCPIVSLDPSSFSSFSRSSLDSKPASSAASLQLQKETPKSRSSRDYSSSRDYNPNNVSISSVKADATYDQERKRRRMHRHSGLHVILLEIFISLMLTPEGALETHYSDRYPMETSKLNAPFFLSYHLNNAANLHLLPCLSERIKEFKPAAYRILKLSWRALFNPRIYVNRVRIARGASSQVYTAKVQKFNRGSEKPVRADTVVLKTVDVPKGPHDPCKFSDVYSEVEILEKFLGEQAVCQLLDYGVDKESFILVLKHYKCSLHTWRRGQNSDSAAETFSPNESQRFETTSTKFSLELLPLYLEVFSAVLQAVKILELRNIVHYDIKCDNILLEPVDSSCSELEFWNPRWPPEDASKSLPFRICIADFGQSKASAYIGGECTMRNRGTEYVKSPEMLKLLSNRSAQDKDSNLYVRSTGDCVGKAVDVWSLGCLLYELLTGEYLFYDEDWLQFFMRVTSTSEDLITKEKVAQLENYRPIVDLLKFILVRDPLQRPSLDNVSICVEQLQLKLALQQRADVHRNEDRCLQEKEKELAISQEAQRLVQKPCAMPERAQSFTEEESDTDQSTADGPSAPYFQRQMPVVRPHIPEPIPRLKRDSTRNWTRLLCCCLCHRQERD